LTTSTFSHSPRHIRAHVPGEIRCMVLSSTTIPTDIWKLSTTGMLLVELSTYKDFDISNMDRSHIPGSIGTAS
jgi:hypothetical protein